MANAPKPTTVKKESSSASSMFSSLAIPICIIVAILVFFLFLGDGSHYKGGDPENDATDVFGLVHKGGYIVPIIMSLLLMVITFSIERFVVISKASGTGSIDSFVKKVQAFLNSGNIDAASAECDKQKGSVANVIKSGLKKYREMENEPNLDVDQKTMAIQKDIEEATSLEMPMLNHYCNIGINWYIDGVVRNSIRYDWCLPYNGSCWCTKCICTFCTHF
jgi:biopolymer transport protein ExbB